MHSDVADTRQRRFAFALTIVFLMICHSHVPAMADDDSLCETSAGQTSVESCTRQIDAALASGTAADTKKVARLYFWRGYAYGEMGRNKKAIVDFNKAIEHNPRIYEAYQYRGIAFQRERKFKRSIVDFNFAINLSPMKSAIYFDRGYSRMHLNQFEQAIGDFTKAIENGPVPNPDAHNMRGYAYALFGDHANAVSEFKQAIALDPRTAIYHHSLGEALSYSGKPQEALAVWKEACKLATPDDARSWHKSLAKHGYYSGGVDQPCNDETYKAFEACAKAKCRY